MTADNLFLGVPADSLPGAFQKHLARIDIFEEAILYTRLGDAGDVRASYQVSPSDLAAALSGVPISTGLLPGDCLFYSRRCGQEQIGIYLPPAKRTLAVVTADTRADFLVHCPPLVFVGQGTGYRIWAVKQRPGADDRLYAAPFPNAHSDSGSICAGNADFPPCTARTIHLAARGFFESHFNEHLAAGKSRAHPENVVDHWRALQKDPDQKYPAGDLVPTSLTLSAMIGGAL